MLMDESFIVSFSAELLSKVVVACKGDSATPVVSVEEATRFAIKHDARFCITSAKTGVQLHYS